MSTLTEPSPPWSGKLLPFTPLWLHSIPPESSLDSGKTAAPKNRILVAEDDAVSRELICARLTKWGYEVVATQDGAEAMNVLRKDDAPTLAILDWMMPGMDGLETCRRVREIDRGLYIILLTARGSKEHLIGALGAGADDYLIKPFDKDELQARILVGLRVMALQASLASRLIELEMAAAEISELRMQCDLKTVDPACNNAPQQTKVLTNCFERDLNRAASADVTVGWLGGIHRTIARFIR